MKKIVMFSISDFAFLTPALNEARMLGNAGYAVDVYKLRNPEMPDVESLGAGVAVYSWDLLLRPLPKTPLFWALKYVEFTIRAVITGIAKRPVVFVAHNLDCVPPVIVAAKLVRSKVVYRAHELSGEIAGAPFASVRRWLERRLLSYIDVVVVPNEERAKILVDEYGAKQKPLVVMNCPYFTTLVESTSLSDWLRSLGLSNRRIALFQGRLGEDRCTEELVLAAQYLDPGNVLVLLGPCPTEFRQHLETLIQQLELGERVLLHDPVPYDQLFSYTCSADLGIVLYRNTDRNNYYCAPNKLFEYFMAGLPIVASDFPGLRKLVEQSGAGLVVDPQNPIEIARAINTILGNPKIANQMRSKSLRNAQLYNWEREGAKLLQMYQYLTREIDE